MIFFTGLLCSIWGIFIISWKGIFKKDLGVLSVCLVSMILCKPSLKLAKSLIMSGMYLCMFCSKSRLFAKSINLPSFLCSKLKVRFESPRTSPGLLWLLTMLRG